MLKLNPPFSSSQRIVSNLKVKSTALNTYHTRVSKLNPGVHDLCNFQNSTIKAAILKAKCNPRFMFSAHSSFR